MNDDHYDIRELTAGDEAAAEVLLDAVLGGRHQARLGELHDVLALPGFGAWSGGWLIGVVTWTGRPDADGRTELASLAVATHRRNEGVGAALLEAVNDAARTAGCRRVWLATTNDNLDALRLYQRHGFRLAELRAGAIDEARQRKPMIPAIGHHGIPVHDELVLERGL